MKRTTKAFLKDFDKAKLFTQVGAPLTKKLKQTVVTVQSWKEALRCSDSLRWQNVRLEQLNRMRVDIDNVSPRRMDKWNDVVDMVHEVVDPLVERLLPPSLERFDSDDDMVNRIGEALKYALGAAALEYEYADLRPPGFYCCLIDWYRLGRFPCGWGTRDETGKLRLLQPKDDDDYNPMEPNWAKLIRSYEKRLVVGTASWPKNGKLVIY
jgi:hypothetical protein